MRLIIALTLLCCVKVFAQDVERQRPAEWEGIVAGGRFQDRFLPMEIVEPDITPKMKTLSVRVKS